MSIVSRAVDALTGGLMRRQDENLAAGVIPPPRDASLPVSLTEAAVIPSVHRALTILTTSVTQLGLTVERSGQTLAGADVPALIRRPCLEMSRGEFLEQLVLSMAATGNAFIYRDGGTLSSETTQLLPLNPYAVTPWRDDRGRVHYDYDGRTYDAGEHSRIRHLRYLTMPGAMRGVGPIQAAQTTMQSARDMREYSSQWWETGQPSGILTTDQPLTGEDARRHRNAWNRLDENGQPIDDTQNPSRVRVLGKGLAYEPLLISPKDALWIEAQSFDTLEIARIFGVPSSLMLTAIDGNSMTYSNVEQEWLGFARFSLMRYLTKIEDALTDLTPRGQSVKFNLDALLRSDTTTRYQAHEIALRSRFLTVDEVRSIEGREPLTPAQRAEIEQLNPTEPAPAAADQETAS